ncbi:DUF922 domain-containing protein [Pelomonas sp. SE-A7]|uniref:DUF922 domain-containing protein n=1 Tax=Pelomonas sp. SE-A7 TaxID=3054953 RepID=UPI00259CF433|nr:DUF922 domain-containing protein [Pelomonas sp. SE-A7]MDM4765581.1 DUF922 domain-containing protein [Pelomonas sp. SE-A7]
MPTRLAFAIGLLAACTLARAEVSESEERETYPVRQSGSQSLLEAVNAATPILIEGKRFHGYTAWDMGWRYRYQRQTDGRCALAQIQTRLSVKITLPELVEADEAARALFDKYLPALTLHEEGHRDIVREVVRKLDAGLQEIPQQASCEALKEEIDRVGQAMVAEARRQGSRYDAATRHGCTQGACLPSRP